LASATGLCRRIRLGGLLLDARRASVDTRRQRRQRDPATGERCAWQQRAHQLRHEGSGPDCNSRHALQHPAASSAPGAIAFVPGSTQKVCQLTGETDRQLNQPTVNQTETRWGPVGNDLGYSFEHDGKLFFVFGDSAPTPKFKGQPKGPNSPLRLPDDNDAIAFTTDTTVGGCLKLEFIHYPNGAYKNPVVLNAQGQTAITLRTDEVPLAGISDGGRMYVFFGTDNPVYPPGPTKGHLGSPTRSIVGVSDDDCNTFQYLHDF
jgi:hypothetical protein